jgi:hypothetical protein
MGPVPSGSQVSGFDPSRPNIARVYDVLAGGHDNYAADRDEAARLLEACPGLRGMVRDNRAFLGRAVTWAAGQGIAQFLDLGTGLPLHPAVHESARAVLPGARVAYVDNDAMACCHVRALLATDERVQAAEADLTDPAAVLADPALRAAIDLAEPVCVVLGLVLGFLPARQAREVVDAYADLVAPGSCVVVSCGQCDDETLWKQLSEAYTVADVYHHSPAEVEGFLAGLEAVPPGIVAAQGWRGGWRDTPVTRGAPACVLAAVARKP